MPGRIGYYWLAMDSVTAVPDGDTDIGAACDDRITVTPLHLDLTHEPSLAMLAGVYENHR